MTIFNLMRNFGQVQLLQRQRQHQNRFSRYLLQSRMVSTLTKDKEIVLKTRNVGIMAHIDAGKTTTTERMLYYSGRIQSPGEVHHGDTVTDFLPQERERGITIQSAVVGFPWKDSLINIIDTPGHVDFTFEVERSLRVVDSAVAILDASAGVEAQTLTVWRQASSYNLPRLIFLNKMDKGSASYEICLDSIRSKLKTTPILLQSPVYSSSSVVGSGSGLVGLVDLINLQRLIFQQGNKGAEYTVEDVSQDKKHIRERCELVEQIADLDNGLATLVIESESIEKISPAEINSAVKRMTLLNTGVPVLLGSSYKNIGVQPLLDGIVRYLPSPDEVKRRDPLISYYGNELCGFAFKTIHDRQLGALTFTRVFSGSVYSGHKVYNVTREKTEKIYKTYLPFANEYKEVTQLNTGDVGVISGLKETITGDTLTSSGSVASGIQRNLEKKSVDPYRSFRQTACLSGVNVPEPVFFCSVEPASLNQQKGLDLALECLKREDPSLRVHIDPDTSQTIMAGMGELHLEILHDRLKTQFKVDCDLGKVMVAYKETVTEPVSNRITFERKLADRSHSVEIELEIHPKKKSENKAMALVRKGHGKEVLENLHTLTERQLRNITNGVEAALRMGPKLSFPVIEVEVFVNFFVVGRGTSETIIEAATAHCVREALKNAIVTLLEPVVSLEIIVDDRFQHIVTEDLNRRRFLLESIDLRHGNKVITGTAPLSELMGYSTTLRTISSGLGTYSMQFSHHNRVSNGMDEEKIMKSVRGF